MDYGYAKYISKEINSLLGDYGRLMSSEVKNNQEIFNLEEKILLKIDIMLFAHSPEIRARTYYEKLCDNRYLLRDLFDKAFNDEKLREQLPLYYMTSNFTDKDAGYDVITFVVDIDYNRAPMTMVRNKHHKHYSRLKETSLGRLRERFLKNTGV